MLLPKNMTSALHQLYSETPYYYDVICNLGIIADTKLQAPGAIVFNKKRGTMNMHINPEMTKDWSSHHLKILLAHEVLHVIFAHLSIKGYNYNWNKACDLIINNNIPDYVKMYPEIEKCLDKLILEMNDYHQKNYGVQFDMFNQEGLYELFQNMSEEERKKYQVDVKEIQDRCAGGNPLTLGFTWPVIRRHPKMQGVTYDQFTAMNSHDLYMRLFLEEEKQMEHMMSLVSQAIDEHSDLSEEEMEGIQEALEDIEGKISITGVVKKAMEDLKSKGKEMDNMPGNLTADIFKSLKAKVNWRMILRNFTASMREPVNIRTWKRRNRRFPFQTPGKKQDKKPVMAYVIDSSGSMFNEDTLNHVRGQLELLLKSCKNVHIIVGDTRECERINGIKAKGNIKKILSQLKFTGGGGTDLQFGHDAAKELGVDGVIVATDGYIPNLNTHGLKTMFVIPPGGRKVEPEKFKNILIEDCL